MDCVHSQCLYDQVFTVLWMMGPGFYVSAMTRSLTPSAGTKCYLYLPPV